jgi:ABC-type glycerol-3-phosphate transport system substrate-binding protein
MRRLALVLVLVALLVAGCSGDDEEGSGETTASAPALADLTSADQLKERFNADRGVPRLIVLVAPT